MKVTRYVSVLCCSMLVASAAGLAGAAEYPKGNRYPVRRAQAAPPPATTTPAPPPAPVPEETVAPIPDSPVDLAPAGLGPGGFAPVGRAPHSWQDVDTGCCDTCGGSCEGDCCQLGCLGGLWYGSVDYLLFNTRMSQAVAAVNRVETSDTSVTPSVSTLTDTVIQYPFHYQSAFRVAAGYRFLQCGGDIQIAYWRFNSQAHYSNGPANVTDNNPFIAGNLENNPGNGQFLRAQTGVTANIFDVDFAKTIAMGGPCNPCECNFCPRWDLRYFAGVRAADISRFNNNQVTEANGTNLSFGNINARFVGAGPRVGIQGRRYFGECGLWSLYARASQALLIGQYEMGRTRNTPGADTTPTAITNQFNTFSRMIPVTDIEIGGTWQLAPFTYFSAGYFWQGWWDLGQGENISGTNFGALDSANILGFDGLFIRGEMLF